MTPSKRRNRLHATALLAAVVLSACVEQDEATVRTRNVQANLVFGVKPPGQPTTPANVSFNDAFDDNAGRDLTLPPFFVEDEVSTTTTTRPGPRVPSPCPKARLGSAPAQPAARNVEGTRPTEGRYKWRREGTTKSSAGATVPISGFEERVVRQVAEVAEGTYRFETVQPDLGTGDIVATEWRVRTTAVGADVNPGTADLPGTGAGEPDRGIGIAKVSTFDVNGTPKGQPFAPVTPLLLLPMPVNPGERFQSVATDPISGETARYAGQVKGRTRVDACGVLAEGWLVEGQLEVTGATTVTGAYNVVFAPQLGGIVLAEHIDHDGDTGSAEVTFSIAQLDPS